MGRLLNHDVSKLTFNEPLLVVDGIFRKIFIESIDDRHAILGTKPGKIYENSGERPIPVVPISMIKENGGENYFGFTSSYNQYGSSLWKPVKKLCDDLKILAKIPFPVLFYVSNDLGTTCDFLGIPFMCDDFVTIESDIIENLDIHTQIIKFNMHPLQISDSNIDCSVLYIYEQNKDKHFGYDENMEIDNSKITSRLCVFDNYLVDECSYVFDRIIELSKNVSKIRLDRIPYKLHGFFKILESIDCSVFMFNNTPSKSIFIRKLENFSKGDSRCMGFSFQGRFYEVWASFQTLSCVCDSNLYKELEDFSKCPKEILKDCFSKYESA